MATTAPKQKQTVEFDKLAQTSGLSKNEIHELYEIFQLVDLDDGGTISTEELKSLMTTLGLKVTKSELQVMINEIDVSSRGEIDFKDFVNAMSRKVNTELPIPELAKAFKLFSHDGLINMHDLTSVLTDYGSLDKRMNKEDAEDLLKSVLAFPDNATFDVADFLKQYN